MKIKLDENLPTSLAEPLRSLGHDVATVYDEHLQAHPDTDVWQTVVQEQRFLITQDVEFGDLRKYPLGSHAGIMLLRLNYPDREAITRTVMNLFRQETGFRWKGALLVVSERKVRILLP